MTLQVDQHGGCLERELLVSPVQPILSNGLGRGATEHLGGRTDDRKFSRRATREGCCSRREWRRLDGVSMERRKEAQGHRKPELAIFPSSAGCIAASFGYGEF
jgi:hypothetical protein